MSMPSSGGGGEAPAGPSATLPPVTAKTEGVVGDSKLKLDNSNSQSSVVSSDKGNVKLEAGTLMLLRVNQ
jgi:hypothetical protein